MSQAFIKKLTEWREHPASMVKELFNIRPDPWQEEALESYGKCKRLALIACKGPGKLQPKSVELWTPTGLRRWGDLQPGDSVFAEDGSQTGITARHENGVVPIYRVFFDDGSSTRVGGEHLWKVRGATERRKKIPWVVITTDEIVRRGVRVKNGRWAGRQWEIPTQGPVAFNHADLPLDPYLVGVWLGDGSKGLPAYSKPYSEVREEIEARGYVTKTLKNEGKCERITIPGAQAKFRKLECFDTGSQDRFVPDSYKFASIRQRRDLLCGLMDTDACIGREGSMEFDSTSERLANDVVWLVRSLGGVGFVKEGIKEGWYRNEAGEKVICRDCYRVTVTLPFNPFRIPHKAERWHAPQQRYLTRYIDRIEPDGEEDAMCIEVAHPSACYLTNDFIVTHNTAVLSWIAWNFLLTRPSPKMAATSVSGDQLRDAFWAEMTKWQSRSELLSAMFEATSEKIFNKQAPKNWWMAARTWPKSGTAEDQANTLAGLHDDYIMFLLDESGSIPDAVMVAAEAALAGGPIEAHIIQAGNPTMLSGPLYRAYSTSRHLWKLIRITADPDDPNRTSRVSIEHAREQIAQYGRHHPYVLVNIFGEFPPSSLNALIGPDEVRAAMKRYYREFEIGRVPKVIGVDISRYGDDESVIACREGIQAYKFVAHRNIDGNEGARIVNRKWEEWEADACFLDGTGGWGSSWEDNLRRLGRSPVSVQFNATAHEKMRFANKRAEMYWDMCDWIRRGGALPPDEEFLQEVTQLTYSIPKDVIILEPKEMLKARIGRSSDRADSLALTFAEPVQMASRSAHRINRNIANYSPFAPMDAERDPRYRSGESPDYSPYG